MAGEIRIKGAVDQTDVDLEFWADGTSGDDSNSGRIVGSPKKTLNAVFELIPHHVNHNVTVNLTGTFTDDQGICEKHVANDKTLLIDGGSAVTDLVGPLVADQSDVDYIGDTGQAWTTDEWAGYIVMIDDGAKAGEHMMIVANDATKLYPAKKWSVAPGAATFRVVRPTTHFDASGGTYSLAFTNYGEGDMRLQQMYFSGSSIVIPASMGGGYNYLTFIISDSSHSNPVLNKWGILHTNFIKDPITFASDYTKFAGVGLRTSGKEWVSFFGSMPIVLWSFLRKYRIQGTLYNAMLGSGSRVKGLVEIDGGYARQSQSTISGNSSSYAVTKIDGASGVGLTILDSHVAIEGDVEISDCGSHAIEINHGRLNMIDAIAGSGNTGAGVYAHSNSVVQIANGSAPTITGTVGDLSTDGTTEVSTWAAIDGGTPIVDLNELTMAKEV